MASFMDIQIDRCLDNTCSGSKRLGTRIRSRRRPRDALLSSSSSSDDTNDIAIPLDELVGFSSFRGSRVQARGKEDKTSASRLDDDGRDEDNSSLVIRPPSVIGVSKESGRVVVTPVYCDAGTTVPYWNHLGEHDLIQHHYFVNY